MTQERWQQLVQWPLIGASAIFLFDYAWKVLADVQGELSIVSIVILVAAWSVFLIDYIVNLLLAPEHWTWFRTHLFDLLVVALPVLRPLRLLGLLTILSAAHRTAGQAIRSRVGVYVSVSTVLLVFLASLAVLDAERPAPGANITSWGNSLWWTFVTVATVGYGDYYPVTLAGRAVAVGLMLGGIALLGVVTATLASWIVDRVAALTGDGQAGGPAAEQKNATLTLDEQRLVRDAETLARDAQHISRGQAPAAQVRAETHEAGAHGTDAD